MHKLAMKVIVSLILLAAMAGTTWFLAGARLASWRADALLESRRHEAALAWINQSLSAGLDNADLHIQLARVHRRLGDTQAATEDLRLAASQGIDKQVLQREQLLLDLKQGRYPQQIEVWRELINTAGSDAPEICEAFVYFRLARFETTDALAILDAWQTDFPNDAQPRYLRGRLFNVIVRTNEAIQQFQEAAEIDPTRDDVLYELALLQMQLLAYTDAESSLCRCLAANADNLEARVLQARVWRKLGRTEAAQEALVSLVAQEPKLASALSELGALHLSQGNAGQAVEVLRRAIELEPVDREMRYLFAQALQRDGQADQAAHEYAFVKEAMAAAEALPKLLSDLAAEPGNIELRFQIAMINWKYQSRSVGLRWFQELLAIDPAHVPTHRALAEYYAERGDVERAEYHQRYAQAPRQAKSNDAEGPQ